MSRAGRCEAARATALQWRRAECDPAARATFRPRSKTPEPHAVHRHPHAPLPAVVRTAGAVGHRRAADVSLPRSRALPLLQRAARAGTGRSTTPQRADLIWKTLFVENTPVSEATRGVVAVLAAARAGSRRAVARTRSARSSARRTSPNTSGDVFAARGRQRGRDDQRSAGSRGSAALGSRARCRDAGFRAALRLDRILNDDAVDGAGERADDCSRRWSRRMSRRYMAVSLPDSFTFPADDARTTLLREAVLPVCRRARHAALADDRRAARR